jgi:DNA-binding transcriptional LysR family regulator
VRLLISRHLEHFLALYGAESMHAAARQKGVSQPALTKSLRLLEDDLGAELFLRTHKGLEPTDAGRALFKYARAIDQEARFASMDIQDMHRQPGGQIRFGVGPVPAVSSFPFALVDFHRRFPNVSVTVEMGISSQLVDGLTRDKLDLVVTALPEEPLPERFTALPLFKSRMIVVCRKGHPLHARRATELDDLLAFGRVGFVDDRDFDKNSRRVFGSRAKRLRPRLETASLTVMFGVLAQTDYFAIVSALILPRARREGLEQLPLKHDLWEIDTELMCKASLAASRPVKAIRDALMARAVSDQGDFRPPSAELLDSGKSVPTRARRAASPMKRHAE